MPGQTAFDPYEQVAKHLLGRHNQLDHGKDGTPRNPFARHMYIRPKRKRIKPPLPAPAGVRLGASDAGRPKRIVRPVYRTPIRLIASKIERIM